MRRLIAAGSLALAIALAAAAALAAPRPPDVRLFAYRAGPLDVLVQATKRQDGTVVKAISFAGGYGRANANLVIPAGKGPFPAVIFYPPGLTDRDYFLDEAVALAKRGIIGLSLDDGLGFRFPAYDASDRTLLVQQVVTLRRALDLLDARSDVYRRRIGYVGLSAGGSFGGILAGVDHRVRALVLASADARWPRVTGLGKTAEQRYEAIVGPLDPIDYVGHAAPSALFFQWGLRDTLKRADELAYQRAGSNPKRVKWYAAGHELNAQAEQDRIAWLLSQLRTS